MATSSDEIRLLLVGKTGKGKSTTGNNILGKKLFNTSPSASSVTTDCELRRNMRNGMMIEIMDAPGLFDTSKPQGEILGHILKAVACMIPGPDAILFVLSIERFTKEEYQAYTDLKTAFDTNITKYIILIFTNAERLDEMKFEDWLKTAPKDLENICTEVENRYMTINNFAGKQEIENKIDTLLQNIRNLMHANRRVPYSCPKYAKVGEEFEKELNKRLEEEEMKAIQKSNAYKNQVAKDKKLLQQKKEKVEKKRQDFEREQREQQKKIQEEEDKQQRQKAEFEKEKQRKERELKEREREQQKKIQEEEDKQRRQKAEFEKEKQRKERELKEREREQQKKIQEEEEKQQRQKAEFEKEKQRKERELKEREREQQKKIQEEEDKQQRQKAEFEKEKQRKEHELKEREREQQKKIQEEEEKQQRQKAEFEKEKQRKERELKEREREKREDEEERRKERLEQERYLKEKEERLHQEEERRQEMIRRMKDEIAENRNPSFWSKFKNVFVGIGEVIGEGISYLIGKISSD